MIQNYAIDPSIHATTLPPIEYKKPTTWLERNIGLIVVFVIFLTLGINFIIIRELNKPKRSVVLEKPKISCKTDTVICQDGTRVTRKPPKCSFESCN